VGFLDDPREMTLEAGLGEIAMTLAVGFLRWW
jgi:hypothetical protein